MQQGVEQVGLRTSRVLSLGCELTAYSVSRCGPPNIGGVKSDRAIRADTALDEPGPQQAVHRLAHRLPALFSRRAISVTVTPGSPTTAPTSYIPEVSAISRRWAAAMDDVCRDEDEESV